MNVSSVTTNDADNIAMRKNSAGEKPNEVSHYHKVYADSVGEAAIHTDMVGSAPVIEYYNNYSKNGMLNDFGNVPQVSQAEPQSTNIAETAATGFDLNSIPSSRLNRSFPPDWRFVPSKGMTALSKDEIKGLLLAFADKYNSSTTGEEKGEILDRVMTLYNNYISHASPDRKTLYEQAMKTIKHHTGGNRNNSDTPRPMTLLDYLNERDGVGIERSINGMKQGVKYPLAGGGSVTFAAVVGDNSGASFDIEHMGYKVSTIILGAVNSFGVWLTPQEQQLSNEIINFWSKAIGEVAIR